jgi:hypothetical protein
VLLRSSSTAGVGGVVILLRQNPPTLGRLTLYICLACLPLGIERVELLIQAVFSGFSGVDSTALILPDSPRMRLVSSGELPRRIKPSSELVRTWNRRTYRVVVLTAGFAYEGRTYNSLSEIAFAITGTKWNGPRFFGLRRAATDGSCAATDPSPAIEQGRRSASV